MVGTNDLKSKYFFTQNMYIRNLHVSRIVSSSSGWTAGILNKNTSRRIIPMKRTLFSKLESGVKKVIRLKIINYVFTK